MTCGMLFLIAYIPMGLLTTFIVARFFGPERSEQCGMAWPLTWMMLLMLALMWPFNWAAKKGGGKC